MDLREESRSGRRKIHTLSAILHLQGLLTCIWLFLICTLSVIRRPWQYLTRSREGRAPHQPSELALHLSQRAVIWMLGLRRAATWLHAHRCASAESAQASLEYLLIAVAFIAMVAALRALWDFADGGGFADIAASLQSHTADSAGGAADALLY